MFLPCCVVMRKGLGKLEKSRVPFCLFAGLGWKFVTIVTLSFLISVSNVKTVLGGEGYRDVENETEMSS